MLILCFFIAFVCLLALPIVYALLVYARKKGPVLPISQGKVRDPRFFAKSFASLIAKSEIDFETNTMMLSKPESFEHITESGFEKNEYRTLVYSDILPLTLIPENTKFSEEIYSAGDACLVGDSALRSIYSKKNIIIGNGVYIGRWADAEGNLAVYDDCDLGISVTSASALSIGNNCRFRRLYAPVVLLGCHPQEPLGREAELPAFIYELDPAEPKVRNVRYVMDDMKDERGIVPYTLISNNNITVTEDMIVQGSIRSEKGVRLSEGAIVCGNIFAESNIILGKNSRVFGTLFTQGSVTLSNGSTVGREGRIVSIVARDEIHVYGKARVYGYLSSEKHGFVNMASDSFDADSCEYLPNEYAFLYLPSASVPRHEIAQANARLRAVSREEMYRFQSPLAADRPSTASFRVPFTEKPVLRRVLLLAALIAVITLCSLSAFFADSFSVTPQETKPPQTDMYRAQGLYEGTALESEPLVVTDDYVVFIDRVRQRFNAPSSELVQDFEVFSGVLDMVPAGVNKYMMLVPLPIYYDTACAEYSGGMREAETELSALLPEDVSLISVFDSLPASAENYLFFRSESCWTAEGAYYGYSAFLSEIGAAPLPLEKYKVSLFMTFTGSLFDSFEQIRDGYLFEDEAQYEDSGEKASAYSDRIYFYTDPDFNNRETVYRRLDDGSYISSHEPVLSKTRVAVSAFVGGASYSHAILPGSVKNGKTILLIGGDSAKVLASYLTAQYEYVYILNQKWYSQVNSTFSEIFDDYNVTDVLMVESFADLGDQLTRARVNRIIKNNVLPEPSVLQED